MSGDNIKVAIRVRPLIERERKEKDQIRWTVEDNVIRSTDPSDSRCNDQYTFDHIFDVDATNKRLYDDVVAPLVLTCVDGYHCTIFTYGQTSSGKTHTMDGVKSDPGIIPRVVDQLFNIIKQRKNVKFLIRVTYVEVYNEKIYDLLCKENLEVKIREDFHGNITVCAEELVTATKDQVMELMQFGKKNRKIHSTRMNIQSSRSHAIFRIIVECTEANGKENAPVKVSHFNLVDLAGSERVAQTKATGQRLVEGAAINRSLSTLTLVISQLADESKFINYRDSKLTLILKNALGGNAKTLIIANVTPVSLEQTHSTLSFAKRAKQIENKPVINITRRSVLTECQKQIDKLQTELNNVLKQNEGLKSDNVEARKMVVILNERIKLNHQLFAKTEVTNGVENKNQSASKRRHTIAQTKNIVADEFQHLLKKDWSEISSENSLTAVEMSLLQVVRVNAEQCSASQSPKPLPFAAQFVTLHRGSHDEFDVDTFPNTEVNLSLAHYTLEDIDSETELNDELQEFLALEDAISSKETITDLRNEIVNSRSLLAAAERNYLQQLSLNKVLESKNTLLSNELLNLKSKAQGDCPSTDFNKPRNEYSQLLEEKKALEEKNSRLVHDSIHGNEPDSKKSSDENGDSDIADEHHPILQFLKYIKNMTGDSKQNHIGELMAIRESLDEYLPMIRLEIGEATEDKEESIQVVTLQESDIKVEYELKWQKTDSATVPIDCHQDNFESSSIKEELNCYSPTPSKTQVFNEMSESKTEIDLLQTKINELNSELEEIKLKNNELVNNNNLLITNIDNLKSDKLHVLELKENLKTMTTALEKAEDRLLESLEELGAKEKQMKFLETELNKCKSVKDFNQNYYESRLRKTVNRRLYRGKSLSSIEGNRKLSIPTRCLSLPNVDICTHKPSLGDIINGLTNLNFLLSKASSLQNFQANITINDKEIVQEDVTRVIETEHKFTETEKYTDSLQKQEYEKDLADKWLLIDQLHAQMNTELSRTEHLQGIIDKLASENAHYNEKLIIFETKYKTLEESCAAQVKENERKMSDLKALENVNEANLDVIINLRQTVADLEEKVELGEKELKLKKSECEGLNTKLHKIEDEYNELARVGCIELSKITGQKDRSLNDLQGDLEQYKKRACDLECLLNHSHNKTLELEQDKTNLLQQVEVLKVDNRLLVERGDMFRHNEFVLREEYRRLKMRYEEVETRVVNLMTEHERYVKNLKAPFEKKISDLTADKFSLLIKLGASEMNVTNHCETIALLKKERSNSNKANKTKCNSCQDLVRENQKLQRLKFELDRVNTVNANLEDRCIALQKQYETAEDHSTSAKHENNRLIDTIEKLKMRFLVNTRELEQLLRVSKEKDCELEKLNSELISVNKELNRIRSRYACDSSSSSPGSSEHWKAKRKSLQDKQRNLECMDCKQHVEKIKNLEMKVFNMECLQLLPRQSNEKEVYYQSIAEVQERQLEELQSKNQGLKKDCIKLQEENANLTRQKEELISKHRHEVADLRDKEKKLAEKYELAKAIARKRSEKISSLEERLSENQK